MIKPENSRMTTIRWQCHKSEHGIVMLISLECRTFQAFLLSNYFITKELANVILFYERTEVSSDKKNG